MINQTLQNRYRITEKIGEGSTSIVYKTHDTKEKRDVILKFPREAIRTNEISSIMRFSQQMKPMIGLENPFIVTVHDEFQHQNFPVVVTEFVSGQSLYQYLKTQEEIDIDNMVRLMIDILKGLEFIHSKGIIHRDIKPSNIMVEQKADTLTARITDFGLALIVDVGQLQQQIQIAGTFSYMSPEQTGMLKKPLDFRSDIYSAGILFYQLLTKRLPFSANDIPTLIHRHIAQIPTAPSVLNSQISPVLDKVILKMLAKDPQDRYQTEKGVITDLEEYLRQRKENKTAIDFEIAKRDRLTQLTYHSRLIGRKKEFESLKSFVDALKAGKGNVVFIGGRAGSGKTRLANELRSYAYTQNAFFVSGKCYKTSYTTPYAVLREALEDYINRIKHLPADLKEKHILLMKNIVGELGGEVEKIAPNLTELLGKQPHLVELDPAKERVRFLLTVTHFLKNTATPENPLVLFLDDLQWADDSSVEILREIMGKIHDSSLLILVTYRREEVDLDRPLTKMMLDMEDRGIKHHIVNIDDLTEEETNQVVAEILSEDPETLKSLSEKIHAQTGGNPFFITELLHALTNNNVIYFEEGHYKYDLSRIAGLSLPDNVIDMLISRIEGLTPQTSQVLSYASVVGRKFTVGDVLNILSFIKPQDVLNSMEEAIEHQFLTRSFALQEEVVFVHDRVREAFYKKVPESERIELNKKIAYSLEEQYKDNLEYVIFDLAYHFLEAGLEEKTLQYSIRAAHKAKSSYANIQAINFYVIARNIIEKKQSIDTTQYFEILENLGESYRLAGRFNESMEALTVCESVINEKDFLRRVDVLSKMADTLWEKGEVEKCEEVLKRALNIFNVKIARTKAGVIISLLKEFPEYLLHMHIPSFSHRKVKIGNAKDIFIGRLLIRLGYAYYFSDNTKMFYAALKALNFLERRVGPCREMLTFHTNGAAIFGTTLLPWPSRAIWHSRLAIKMSQELNDKIYEARSYGYFSLVLFPTNKPEEGLDYARKAIKILTELGEYWELGVAYAGLLFCHIVLGRLIEGLGDCEEGIATCRKADSLQSLGWCLILKGKITSFIGYPDDKTIETMEEGRRLFIKTRDGLHEICAIGTMAFAYFRKGDMDRAIEYAEEFISFFKRYPVMVWWLDVFPMGAEVYLGKILLTPDLEISARKKLLKKAGWFCRKAMFWAYLYKSYLGYACQVNGTYQWLRGKKKKAIRLWERGINFLREKTEDKYRLARILQEEGKFLCTEEDGKLKEKARKYLEEARQLFMELGVKQDLQENNDLLGIKEEIGEDRSRAYEETTVATLAEKERALSLVETTKLISSILDLDKLLDKIVDLAIKMSGAERGFLMLYSPRTNKMQLVVSFPKKEDVKNLDFTKLKISKTIISYVEQQKEGVIYPPMESQKDLIDKSESIQIYGIRSILCSPLLTKDRLIGMLYLDNHLAEGVFEQKDSDTLNSICSQAAVSIENARLFKDSQEKVRLEHEINTARQIQQSLLPAFSPQVQDLKVEGLMLSAKEVAGDYYDFISSSPQKVGIVVADVSGKGMDAGMVMSMVKANIFPLAQQNLSPKDLIIRLNSFLYQQLQQQKFISLIYAEYTAENNTFTWGGAGHEHVLVFRAPQDQNAQPEMEVIKTGGIVLGMFEDIGDMINQQTVTLNKGDRVILYSDGATEARNLQDDMLSLQGLVEIIKNAPAMSVKDLLGYLKDQILQFMGSVPQYDDITLVVLGRE